MPQPSLHVLIGAAQLERWRRWPADSPLDACDGVAANAFLVGTLGPDLGLFPGGRAEVSRLAHTSRTAVLLRSLMAHARTDAERAFAWGWLSHFTADIAIHPLVNAAADDIARRRGTHRTLLDHVRVEVGLDAWFGWQHDTLRTTQLRPAFDRAGWGFLVAAYADVHAHVVTPAQLARMQAGLLRFTALSAFFVRTAARSLCWQEPATGLPVPVAAAVPWRLATVLSGRGSMVNAYLNPLRPAGALVAAVERGMHDARADFDLHAATGLHRLRDHDLETGARIEAARHVA